MSSPARAGSQGSVVIAGRYELLEILGTGGASRVHAARDAVTGARVAVGGGGTVSVAITTAASCTPSRPASSCWE